LAAPLIRQVCRAAVSAARTEQREEIAALRADLVRLELRLTLRLGAAGIAIAGILFAALHYWPPHP
jgi:hypothetical protein